MFCPECGKEIADGAVVCPLCGMPVTSGTDAAPEETQRQEAPETGADAADAPKESGGEKKIIPLRIKLIAAAAVLLVLAVAVFAVVRRLSYRNFGKQSEHTVFSTSAYSDVTLTNGHTLIVPEQSPGDVITLEGTLQRTFQNLDGSISGMIFGQDQVLYQISGGKESFIEENVAGVSYSTNGRGLAFTTGTWRFDNTERSDLYLRNGAKNERISRDCVGESVFSPSGRYLLYVEYDGKNYTLLLHNGKKAREILSSKRRIAAIGIRDDGKRMYYAVKDANGNDLQGAYTLYHYDSETFTELGGFLFGSRILLNRDLSQILFVSDKNAWFSENGEEPVKLRMGGSSFLLLTPRLTAVQYGDSTLEPDIYDAADFRNTFVLCDDTLYLFNGEEFKTISRKVLDAQVLNNEKTLLIRKTDGGLFRMNGRKENAKEEEITADEIDLYGSSADGKTVYYITKNAELYLCGKTGAPVKLSGENGVDAYLDPGTGRISHLGQIAYREKNSALYFVEGGALYVSAKEKEVTTPSHEMEGDVTGVTCYRDLIQVTTLADGLMRSYLSTDGETFTLLDEGYLSD